MGRQLAGTLASLFVLLCFTSLAWGVVGTLNVTVRDAATGQPVPHTKVKLTPQAPGLPEREGETDQDGKAGFMLEEGGYTARVSSRDYVTTSTQIIVRGGQTTSTDVSFTPIFPWMVQIPGGVPGGFVVSLGYSGEWRRDFHNTLTRSKVTSTNVITEDSDTFVITAETIHDSRQLNRDVDFKWDVNGGVVDLHASLPAFYVTNFLKIYSAVGIEAGGTDVRFDFRNRVNPSQSTFLKGNGPLVGVGFDIVATLISAPQWFFGWGYKFQSIPHMGLDRSPSPKGFLGEEVLKNDASLSYHSHSLYGRLGYTFFGNRLSPYLGIRGNWADLDVEEKVQSRFLDTSLATVQDTTVKIRSEFGRQAVEGIAGMDIHFWGPLFGRAEAAFTGSDVAAVVKIVYGFGFVDR